MSGFLVGNGDVPSLPFVADGHKVLAVATWECEPNGHKLELLVD